MTLRFTDFVAFGDHVWFALHPGRSLHVRESVNRERPHWVNDEHTSWPLMLVVKRPNGDLDYRPLRGTLANIPDTEEFLFDLWTEILQHEALRGPRVWNIAPERHAELLGAR